MRISTRTNDPGYHPQAHLCLVIFNGIQERYCFTADEEQNTIYCYHTDKQGNMVIKPNGDLLEIRKKGIVKIIGPDHITDPEKYKKRLNALAKQNIHIVKPAHQ